MSKCQVDEDERATAEETSGSADPSHPFLRKNTGNTQMEEDVMINVTVNASD